MNERAELYWRGVVDAIFVGISATMDFRELRMHNFAGEYLQVIERAGCGCIISMRSILTLLKTCDVDAKFAKEVSSSSRKGKMQMQFIQAKQAEKHLQVQRRASCRYIGLKKSICGSKYQGSADTSVAQRTSTTVNKPRI